MATLVVLDRPRLSADGSVLGAVPLTRLWCLYEIGTYPALPISYPHPHPQPYPPQSEITPTPLPRIHTTG